MAASTVAPEPFKKLRDALEAAKRKGPPPRQQAVDPTVKGDTEAPVDSPDAAVGTSGGGEPPSPTATVPSEEAQLPLPSARDHEPASTDGSRAREQRGQARTILIGLGFVGTVLLLVFALFSEHHRHE